MLFPIILMLFINGDPLPWAGFQTAEACEQVRSHMSLPQGVKGLCVKTQQASTP
jgi:hypothetical protein